MACKQLRHACLWLVLKNRACLDHLIPEPTADTREANNAQSRSQRPCSPLWVSGDHQGFSSLVSERDAATTSCCAERRRSEQRRAAGHCTRRGWTWSSCCTAWVHSPNRWLILRECILTTPSRSCPTKRSAKGPSGVMMVSARHGCPHRVTCCRQGFPEVGAALKRPS